MNQPLFRENTQGEFTEKLNDLMRKGFDRLQVLFAHKPSIDSRIAVMHAVYEMSESILQVVKAHLLGFEIRCHKGCSYCCITRVEILPVEAIQIARYLLEQGEGDPGDWIRALEDHKTYAEGRREEDYQRTCPFLDSNGACRIYSVRPYRCRIHHSLDENHCLTKRQNVRINLVSQVDSVVVRHLIKAFRNEGLSLRPSELGQAVLWALQHPSAEEDWLKGENPFPVPPEYSIVPTPQRI